MRGELLAMKRIIVVSLMSLLTAVHVLAQSGNLFISAEQTENGVRINTTNGVVNIRPYTTSALEVEFVREEAGNPPSYSIAIEPEEIASTYSGTGDTIKYSAGGFDVSIVKKPFGIAYSYKGRNILAEERGYFNNDTLEGFRFKLASDEKLMGGGSRVLGMNRRGNRLKLYNRASYGYETHADLMYYSMPVVISSKKYMLVFDNGASGFADLGATEKDVLTFEAVGGRMSYLVVAADQWEELVVNFTELTGRQPMVPRWAMGNITSRMGYHSQQEVIDVADKYIEDDIPLDAIVLDLYWFGPDLKGHMGNLEWDLDSFPEPGKMISDLKAKGVKTVLITEPFILQQSGKFEEAKQKEILATDSSGAPYIYDFFFGTTSLIDIFKPEAKEWFWEIYKKNTILGIEGWWGDLGEPEVHPDDILHVNGRGDHVHNIYGHEWARVVYDGFSVDFPKKRPVILMRSGFVGSQRYGLIPWSGDVNRSWGGLKSQVEISLQMGMQGLAYMHSDLGGFAGNYKDAELYIRWLQYGVFQPVYRTHAQEEVPPEPVFWDEGTKSIVRKYIKLRYALMPYNYTLVHENAMLGIPMMRPLFYFDDKAGLLDEKNDYLWGDNFLVSPVVDKGATEQEIYLPDGNRWVDYWTGEIYDGGQNVVARLGMRNIPVFVKAGSFIPMVPVFENMEEYSSRNLLVHYYHDESVKNSNGYMYEDDGKTKDAFKNNEFERINFESRYETENGLEIIMNPTGFSYLGKPDSRNVELIVHGLKKKPKKVMVNGKKMKVVKCWDENSEDLKVFFNLGNKGLQVLIQ